MGDAHITNTILLPWGDSLMKGGEEGLWFMKIFMVIA